MYVMYERHDSCMSCMRDMTHDPVNVELGDERYISTFTAVNEEASLPSLPLRITASSSSFAQGEL